MQCMLGTKKDDILNQFNLSSFFIPRFICEVSRDLFMKYPETVPKLFRDYSGTNLQLFHAS